MLSSTSAEPCGAYFSANEAERQQLQDDRYLNLRFRGDHRPYLGLPPVLPRAAHRAASDDSTTMCHSTQDECLQSMDCGSGADCTYDAASTRFTCRAAPPEMRK